MSQTTETVGNGVSPPEGYISISDAIELAEKVGIKTTTATMINWVEKHKLGFQPGGINSKWYVRLSQFQEFLNGKANTQS